MPIFRKFVKVSSLSCLVLETKSTETLGLVPVLLKFWISKSLALGIIHLLIFKKSWSRSCHKILVSSLSVLWWVWNDFAPIVPQTLLKQLSFLTLCNAEHFCHMQSFLHWDITINWYSMHLNARGTDWFILEQITKKVLSVTQSTRSSSQYQVLWLGPQPFRISWVVWDVLTQPRLHNAGLVPLTNIFKTCQTNYVIVFVRPFYRW
jgi:hypothetical protein